MVDFTNISIPDFTPEAFDGIVARRLCQVNDQIMPPIDVELIAERAGFDLIDIAGLKYISSTDAFLSHSERQIYFDPDVSTTRIRFSIAHELGHFDLHYDILKEVRFCDYSEWKTTIISIPGWFWGAVEQQANVYAGKLLVPREMIIASIPLYKYELQLALEHIPNNLRAIREYLAVP